MIDVRHGDEKVVQRPSSGSKNEICQHCHKKIGSAGGSGSLIAYFFTSSYCTCVPDDLNVQLVDLKPRSNLRPATEADRSNFCPDCGLQMVEESRPGSITGYLFQDVRCKCKQNPVFVPGYMTQALLNLKQNDQGRIFSRTAKSAKAKKIDLLPGAIIGGVYRIEKAIGAGGMGEVYLAQHTSLGKQCALKVIPPDQVTELGWRRFQLEAKALSKLVHQNIVQVTDLGIHESCLPFYSMEFVQGENLAEIVAENGPLPVKDSLAIFKQVCDGVGYAHQNGIVHRDLKPANIMVDRSQTKIGVKVLDFGLAKLTQADRNQQSLTATGDVFGSPFYMSPEQGSGGIVDSRSDIYSIGCALFECLTGRPPFAGTMGGVTLLMHQTKEPPKLGSFPDVGPFDENIEAVVAKLLAKKPLDRYQYLEQLKADLERVEKGQTVKAITEKIGNFSAEKLKEKDAERAANDDSWPQKNGAFVPALSIAALIALSLGLIGLISYSFFKPASKKTVTEIAPPPVLQKEIDSQPVKIRKLKPYSGKAFYVGSIKSPPLTIKRYIFPTEKEIEALKNDAQKSMTAEEILRVESGRHNAVSNLGSFQAYNINPVKTHILAGAVSFPDTEINSYTASDFVLNNLSYLSGFRDGDFTGISLNWPSTFDTAELQSFPPSIWQMSSIHSLEMFALPGNSRAAAEQNEFDLINHFVHLHTLILNGTTFSAEGCKKLSPLKSLHSLVINSCLGIENLLDALSGSDKITSLTITHENISSADIAKIAQLRSLNILAIGHNSKGPFITPQDIHALSHLNKLTALSLPYFDGTLSCLQELKAFKSLKTLTLVAGDQNEEQYERSLKRYLPNCAIQIVTGRRTDPSLFDDINGASDSLGKRP